MQAYIEAVKPRKLKEISLQMNNILNEPIL